jgi:hypothetical protein
MKKYSNLILIVACLLSCILIFINFRRINAGKNDGKAYERINDSLAMEKLSADNVIKTFYAFENQEINGHSVLQTPDNNRVAIKSLFSGNNFKLVFLLTDQQCDLCVDFVATQIDTQIRKNPELKDRVLMLAGYDSWIQFSRYLKIKNISFPAYRFSKTVINPPFARIEKPTLFLLDSQLKARFVFIPDKAKPQMFHKYLDFAKRLLSTKFQSKKL